MLGAAVGLLIKGFGEAEQAGFKLGLNDLLLMPASKAPQWIVSAPHQNALEQRVRNVNLAHREAFEAQKIPKYTMASCLIIVIIHQTPDVMKEKKNFIFL